MKRHHLKLCSKCHGAMPANQSSDQCVPCRKLVEPLEYCIKTESTFLVGSLAHECSGVGKNCLPPAPEAAA